MSWRALLEGTEGERALARAQALAREVAAAAPAVASPTLGGGQAGFALCFAYLGMIDHAVAALERAIDQVAAGLLTPSLWAGFSGVAWVMEHLRGRVVAEDDDSLDAIDAALGELLNVSPWQGEYELVQGLTGFAVYALERLPAPSGRALLETVVTRLGELAQRDQHGVRWVTVREHLSPRAAAAMPEGAYDLGMAHGMPATLRVLAACRSAGVAAAQAQALLDGAMPWLLAQAPGAAPYPYFAGEPDPARAAWCYGDVGIAAALLGVALDCANPDWQRAAMSIADRAAGRDMTDSGVTDAALCHGAGGVGHILNRVWQLGGGPAAAEAARAWFTRALELPAPGEPSLLEGKAGLALALAAAAGGEEPAWDRVLAVSSRAPILLNGGAKW